ncbi:unnamed protein product, partial [Rotaria magnacalcarata]
YRSENPCLLICFHMDMIRTPPWGPQSSDLCASRKSA